MGRDEIWILQEETDIKLRVLLVAHCGNNEQIGSDVVKSIFRLQYGWDNLAADVRVFLNASIHRIITRSGEQVSRLLDMALHGQRSSEFQRIYFLSVGSLRDSQMKNVSVIKDYLTPYCWLPSHSNSDSDVLILSLNIWKSGFENMNWRVSDQDPHFMSSFMRAITAEH